MKQIRPWLLLLLVFVAGFTGGIVASRVAIRHFVQRAVRDPDFMRERVERRMVARLRLDPQQQAKVHDVLVGTQSELKELRADVQPRFQTIMNRAQSEIAATLTPEQRQRFERFRQENRFWFQAR